MGGRKKLTQKYDDAELLVLAFVLRDTPRSMVQKAIKEAQEVVEMGPSEARDSLQSFFRRAAQRKIWHALDRRVEPTNNQWK